MKQQPQPPSWQQQMKVVLESLVLIYIASFCLGWLYIHRGPHWLIPGIVAGTLYTVIFCGCILRMIQKLTMPALMIAAPTIPLIIMIFALSLIPILQLFQ